MTRCNKRLTGCNNVATIGKFCSEHMPVLEIVMKDDVYKEDKDTLPMSPQQKAAKTKALKKLKKAALIDELAKLE